METIEIHIGFIHNGLFYELVLYLKSNEGIIEEGRIVQKATDGNS